MTEPPNPSTLNPSTLNPPTLNPPAPRHRVVIVVFDGVQSLDVTGPAEVFAGADELLRSSPSPDRGYEVVIVSLGADVVTTESAVRFAASPIAELGDGPIDTLVIPGGFAVSRHRDDEALVETLGHLIDRSGRLVTVCTGAYLAAAAGALTGHTITTHWARSTRLAQLHPELTVDDDPIFIHSPGADRDVWSSAGVTAGIDLCLALVEQDHSTEVAQTVARWLVMYLRRPGGQSQFATPTWIRQAPHGPIRQAQALVVGDPGADHRVLTLAGAVAMSERHFVRRFTTEVGIPPAKYVARVRIDAARHELEHSLDTIGAIAQRCGFGTAETLRRALHRHMGISPEGYRARFNHQPPPIRRTSHAPANGHSTVSSVHRA